MTWNENLLSTLCTLRSRASANLLLMFLQVSLWCFLFFCTSQANAQTTLNPGATINITTQQGQAFSQNFIGTGTQDNSYSLNGLAPPGLGISTVAPPPPATFNHEMVLFGTPTTVGTFSFNIEVSASFFSAPVNYSTTLVVTVLAAPPIANPSNLVVLQNSVSNLFTPSISGSATGISLATSPAHGSATVSGLSILYTPVAGYVGSDTFRYQAAGPGGTSSPATISVLVNPLPPNVTPSSVVVSANSNANVITPSISGIASSISSVVAPAHGVASVSGLNLLYTPTAGYVGGDSVTIVAAGPGGTSAATTLTITVNPPPPIVSTSTVSVLENSASNSIVPIISGNVTSVAVVGMPAHGVVSVNGLGLIYTPSAGYVGSDSVSITATGSGGTSVPAVISINVNPLPPALTASSVTVLSNSVANSITPLITGNATSIATVTTPAHGVVTVVGTGLSYTPAAGYVGNDSFAIIANGPGGASNSAIISVSVNPSPPVVIGSSVVVSANSINNNIAPIITGSASSISLTGSAAHGVVTVVGMSLLYTPIAGYSGSDSIALIAVGPGGSSPVAIITITVNPPAPVIMLTSANVLMSSIANRIDPNISGSATSVNILTGSGHGITTVTGLGLVYTPTAGYIGSDSVAIEAIGPGGSSGRTTISITVNPLPPLISNSSASVLANSVGNRITPVIVGAANSIDIVGSAAHGAVTVDGLSLLYTPNAGYFGGDSVVIVAVGSGGNSSSATISINVSQAPPVIAATSISVLANSSGNIISPAISGSATSITVVSNPVHGTVIVSGLNLIFTPSAGYIGNDNLVITATGPGGVSSSTTFPIIVTATPPVLTASAVSFLANSSGNVINPVIAGGASNINLIGAPGNGSATVNGLVISYSPISGFVGSDSIVVSASGPGGTSNLVTISIMVVAPPPILMAKNINVFANSSVNNVTPLIEGIASNITVTLGASHGNAYVNGLLLFYTPEANFVGNDSVNLIATGPGGTSSPVTISISVTNAAPIVADMNLAFPLNSSANLINPLVSGVATGLSIINPPAHGVVSVNGFSLRYTPVAGYVGNDTIGIAAIGPGGSSALANITISVTATPPVVAESSFTVPIDSADNLIRPQITGTASTISIVNGALHGTTTVDGLGIRYTPNRNYVGVDVFSVNATGPGGTSEPALVSISVLSTVPKLDPISITVAKDSREIRISPVITGNASSLNIISGPSHGLITLNGLELRYTPNSGFSGTDQVVISATGANGNSPPVSLSITVIPEFPSILPMTVSVPKNSSANQIKPSLSGNVSTVSVVTSPLHGVISVSGLGVIYTPNTGFVGTDTVLVVANGVNASSSPALITINVQAEPPKLSDATAQVAANSISNVIAPKISGEATALQIVDAASHGNLIVRGLELLYTPASGFVGTDSVTVSASGNFGTSNLAKITITVQAISGATNTSVVQANSTANILPVLNLEGVQSLNISGQPTQGSVVVQGLGLSYTPKQNYVGPDSVSYSLLGSNGSFASGTIQISVVAAAPVLKNANLTVETGRSGSIDLASLISGPTFSGVSIRLNGAPAHGVATVNGTLVTYTSTVGYVGTDSLQLTATAVGGTSNVAQLMITVIPRPDPSKDPGVLAMFAANTAAVRHFEQTQIEHFNGRMLSLATQSAAGKSAGEQKNERECGAISYWVSGLNSTGRYRTVNGLKYSTLGFSAGGDRCFAGGQTHIGFGVGYARDHSESERDLSFMKATANTAASYLTTQLLPSMRFSFMLGVNQIQDRFARFEDNDLSLAYGEWKGSQMISSGAISSDLSFGKVILVPYVRLDMAKLKLDPFSESGDGDYLLHYHKQTMLSQRSTLGFNSEMKVATSWGELIPRLKVELQRDFARRDSLKINYIDVPDAVYLVPNNDLDRRMILISLGADMMWKNGMVTIINFTHSNANAGNKANRLNLRFSYQY